MIFITNICLNDFTRLVSNCIKTKRREQKMPLLDVLTLFFLAGVSAIKLLFAIPLLYYSRCSTMMRICRINGLAVDRGILGEAAARPNEEQPTAADDPRMWGAEWTNRMDQLARKQIFPLAVLN
jgi:hypothetical protein